MSPESYFGVKPDKNRSHVSPRSRVHGSYEVLLRSGSRKPCFGVPTLTLVYGLEEGRVSSKTLYVGVGLGDLSVNVKMF